MLDKYRVDIKDLRAPKKYLSEPEEENEEEEIDADLICNRMIRKQSGITV